MQLASHMSDELPALPNNVIPMLRPLFKAECHVFEHRGNQILFDVATGNFFEIDDVARDMLAQCEGHTLRELMSFLEEQYSEKQILSAFKELFSEGILSDLPPEKPRPFVPPARMEVVHFSLDITSDTLEGTPEIGVAYMDESVALKTLDLLFKESGRIRQCRITFEGGEPLLNAPLVEKVIAAGHEKARQLGKEISFEVVTDGRLLNEELASRLLAQDVEIAILHSDADEEPLFMGSGPYSLSSGKIGDHLLRKHAAVHVKHMVDRNRLDLLHSITHGQSRYPSANMVSLSLRTAQTADGLTEIDLPQALAALEKLADHIKTHAQNEDAVWIHLLEDPMNEVFNQNTFVYHCGVGVRSLVVAPSGRLYADAERTVDMGDVQTGIDRDRQKAWIRATHIEALSGCASCWARHLCGGACRIGQTERSEPNLVACQLKRRTYELAMDTCLDIAAHHADHLHRRYADAN